MKKFLVVLSVLALLLIAGPVQADWTSDLPITEDTNFIGAKFSADNIGIITLKTKSGSCMKYKIVGDEIVKIKKCSDANWKDFIKE